MTRTALLLVIATGAALACTKTGVIARDRTLISAGVPEQEEPSFLIGSHFTFHAGLFDRCRTSRETVNRDMFGGEDTKRTYDEEWCNERPVPVNATCSGAGCEVRDNQTPDVTVVATTAGVLAIDTRVVADDGSVRAQQQSRYTVVVPDELRWYADTAPLGPVDATGCAPAIGSAEEFPNGAVLRYRGTPVRFPRPDAAPAVTARACLGRIDTGAAPTCWEVAVDDNGALTVPAADVLQAGGHGSYEATVEYEALTVRCATEYR
jgi:hypothetical protein